MSDTGRLDYEVYMQTVEGNAGDLTYPYGTNVVEEQVRWHNETFGYVPSVCAYQGGQYSYADYIHEYILAGRNSAPDGGYDYGFTTKINTRHFKMTARMGDPGYVGAGISNSMAFLDAAITNGGFFYNFNHWHTNPYGDAPTLYDFLDASRDKINNSGKRISTISVGNAIQYRWLRDISAVSMTTSGSSLDVAVTYSVPSWMMVEWGPTYTNHPNDHLRPIDAFRIPVSVRVDLSGTPLSGSNITAVGASSLRNLGVDDFVVEVPFNRSNETVTVTISATGVPDYANEALPIVDLISRSGTNWQVVTDQKTRLVLFSLPMGKSLSEIHAVDSVDIVEAPEALRFNTFISSHNFSVADSTNREYYVGLMTDQMQSILVPLIEMSGENPVITLLGDNPLELVVGDAYVESGATAHDYTDGDISGDIVIDASAFITNWMYLATVIDTGNKIAKVYQYDNTGNLIGSAFNKSLTVYSWDITNGAAKVSFNYTYVAGTTNWIDDFSIDNYELTPAELQARVNKVVSGMELGDVSQLAPGMSMIIR